MPRLPAESPSDRPTGQPALEPVAELCYRRSRRLREPTPKSKQLPPAGNSHLERYPRGADYLEICWLRRANPVASASPPRRLPQAAQSESDSDPGAAAFHPLAGSSSFCYLLVHHLSREMTGHSPSARLLLLFLLPVAMRVAKAAARKLEAGTRAAAEARADSRRDLEGAIPPRTSRKSDVAGNFRNRTFHNAQAWILA